MNLTVHEKSFSLTSEYDIAFPGGQWFARKAFFSFKDKVQLRSEDGNILARINGRFFSFLRSLHDFQLADGRLYHFRCEKFWTGVFVCEREGECYRLYQHKGLNFSIFLGDKQIAAFTKNRVVIGKGHRYDIRMNADVDRAIVVCLVLTLNTSQHTGDDTAITIDLGNIGLEDRPFDESWEPV